jgi:inner membrane protein
MDIITHTLSGIAMSTIAASLSKKPLWKKGIIICCGAIGGAFPDIDVISLWSGFDTTIGKFFDLPHKGRDIYFSNYWYSHHNFTHSLIGGVTITVFIVLLSYLVCLLVSKNKNVSLFLTQKGEYFLAIFFGYVAPLMGDLPTPGHTWDGIKLFWPLSTPIGATGHLWWWNNYDIFLIVFICCAINFGLILLYHLSKKPFIRYLPVIICVGSLLAVLYQIHQRDFSFAYSGYTKRYDEYERKSLDIQREILGEKLYKIMVNVDHKLTIYF